VEETHPMDGNDSDYDPKKEAKKEVMIITCFYSFSTNLLKNND
jgi:hypothetical protein